MARSALSPDEQLLLTTIYRAFDKTGKWPTFHDVDRILVRDIDAAEVGYGLPEGLLQVKPFPGSNLGQAAAVLTFEGCLAVPEARPLLEDLVKTVRAACDVYFSGTDRLVLTASQLRERTGMTDVRLLQVYNVFAPYIPFWAGSTNGSSTLPTTWEIQFSTRVRAYKDVNSIEDLARVRAEDQRRLNERYARNQARVNEPAEVSAEAKPNTAFVVMHIRPGKPGWDDVLRAIKETCADFGIQAVRVDEVEHQDPITDTVLRMIRESEYVVADLTGERPNVYYEVGYAHALRKKPILYRAAGTKLHFDLAVHNVPEYESASHLRELLAERLTAMLGHGPVRQRA